MTNLITNKFNFIIIFNSCTCKCPGGQKKCNGYQVWSDTSCSCKCKPGMPVGGKLKLKIKNSSSKLNVSFIYSQGVQEIKHLMTKNAGKKIHVQIKSEL